MTYLLQPYDDALTRIINGFEIDGDRTGVGTLCAPGQHCTYDISTYFPVPTRRRVVWRSFIKEVLWYISGSHNIKDLEAMGASIWTPWKSKEFTDSKLLPDGSGGYIYGFNLIHYGASIGEVDEWRESTRDLERAPGFNQLDYVINTLRNNPKSRQAAFTFWRPDTNDRAILPACHAFYHFFVTPDVNGNMTVLNCSMFQRSADWIVGVWANLIIASAFTYMIAQQLDMTPGALYHSASHAHIYKNAFPQAIEYLSRDIPKLMPRLIVNKKPSIYEYTIDDFDLIDYEPLAPIKMPIAV